MFHYARRSGISNRSSQGMTEIIMGGAPPQAETKHASPLTAAGMVKERVMARNHMGTRAFRRALPGRQ